MLFNLMYNFEFVYLPSTRNLLIIADFRMHNSMLTMKHETNSN